jgi:hypothetical protein
MPRVTSDAQARPTAEDEAVSPPDEARTGDDKGRSAGSTAERKAPRRRADAGADLHDHDHGRPAGERRRRVSAVGVLAVLLVLLLGLVGFLWTTRPDASTVRTDSYVEALQAARSGIVDMTSFDHLTIDDDIEQIRRVTTGDLRDEAVAELEERRADIVTAEAVVSTEIVGAGVTRADAEEATVMMVMQSTQSSSANPQTQIVRYRIEVQLQKEDGRWLLSSITGTGGDE